MPLNTFGGALGEGRLHGIGHLREAVVQVMGRAGDRQVPGVVHSLVQVGVPERSWTVDVPVKSLPDFLEYAKKYPGKLNYSQSGIGGSSHLATAAFLAAAGVDVLHVPYKGGGPALQAVLANEVQLLLMSSGATNEQVEAGNLRRLALTSRERSPLLPNVPTAMESGVSNYEYYSWFGFFAPGGTSDGIVKKLQQEIAAALKQPKIADGLRAGNYEIGGKTSEAFRARVAAEVKAISETIRKLDIKVQ